MARHAKFVITVAEGVKVGYAPKPRGGLFRVQFRHPSEPGKYVEAARGCGAQGVEQAEEPTPGLVRRGREGHPGGVHHGTR